MTDRAAAMAVEILERPKTINDAGADRTDQVPVDLEKTQCGGVQEEIDGFQLPKALVSSKSQWIDPQKLGVARRTNVALKLRNKTWGPWAHGLQRR